MWLMCRRQEFSFYKWSLANACVRWRWEWKRLGHCSQVPTFNFYVLKRWQAASACVSKFCLSIITIIIGRRRCWCCRHRHRYYSFSSSVLTLQLKFNVRSFRTSFGITFGQTAAAARELRLWVLQRACESDARCHEQKRRNRKFHSKLFVDNTIHS